jgi:tetratricopeptide (TPR) repeat protein
MKRHILAIACLAVAQLAAQPAPVPDLSALQSAAERAPSDPFAHYNLGRAYAARGDWEQARREFLTAIELRPDYMVPRLALAQLQVTRGEFDAALQTVDDLLIFDKSNINARLIQSSALMGQKKFDASRRVLDELAEAHPDSPDVWFQFGVLELAGNHFEAAESAFRRAQVLNPQNSRGLMGVVETYMAQNKTGDALEILGSETEKDPTRQDLLLAFANTAVRAGKYDLAVQSFNRMLAQADPNSKQQGDIYLRIGETYRRKGDSLGAIQALQKARETMPDNVVVLSTLALVLDGAGRRREAQQVYEATLKLDPNNAVALNNFAFLLAESGGDLDAALTMAQRARQLLPELYEITDTLGWIYLKKNLSDQAIDAFSEIVKKQSARSTYRYHLGMAYAQKGDQATALSHLAEALKLNPTKDEHDKIESLIATFAK